MSGSVFSNFFSGTMGILIAVFFFFIGLPILLCSGCFGTLAFIGSQVEDQQPNEPSATSPQETQVASADPNGQAPKKNTKSSDPGKSSKSPVRQTWVTIFEEQGKGTKKTVSFDVSGSNTTLQYAYSDKSGFGASLFSVSVYKSASDTVVDFAAVNETGESNSDQTRLRLSPGSYYLSINAANCDWQIKVIEYLDETDERARKRIEQEEKAEQEEQKQKQQQAEKAVKDRVERKTAVENEIRILTAELTELQKETSRPIRTWKSKDQTYSVSASYVNSEDYKIITLKKESGDVIEVERKKLCYDDLVYLSDLKKADDAKAEKQKQLPSKIKKLQEELKSLVD